MHIFVDKIPGMTIDGEGNLEMDEEETTFTESISIIYRGDGDVEPPPTTYAVTRISFLLALVYTKF